MKTIQIASPTEAIFESLRAGWWTLLMARLFGRRVEAPSGGDMLIIAHWRGRWYSIKATENRRAD